MTKVVLYLFDVGRVIAAHSGEHDLPWRKPHLVDDGLVIAIPYIQEHKTFAIDIDIPTSSKTVSIQLNTHTDRRATPPDRRCTYLLDDGLDGGQGVLLELELLVPTAPGRALLHLRSFRLIAVHFGQHDWKPGTTSRPQF